MRRDLVLLHWIEKWRAPRLCQAMSPDCAALIDARHVVIIAIDINLCFSIGLRSAVQEWPLFCFAWF